MSEQVRDTVEDMFNTLNLKSVDAWQKEIITKYILLILEWLQKVRLTGEKNAEGIIWQQLYDSLYLLKLTDLNTGLRVIDLGSGGGLPGIPLKICRPGIKMYLMDSSKKKAGFLKEAIDSLGLKDAHILCGRAEEFGKNKDHREQYDLVVCKAVAETAVLTELALPLLKLDGRALIYKGPRGREEAEEAKRALEICGGRISAEWQYDLSGGETRSLYEIKKESFTPHKYPRRPGVPERKPIY